MVQPATAPMSMHATMADDGRGGSMNAAAIAPIQKPAKAVTERARMRSFLVGGRVIQAAVVSNDTWIPLRRRNVEPYAENGTLKKIARLNKSLACAGGIVCQFDDLARRRSST